MFSQELTNIKCFTDRFSEEQRELNRITADTFGLDYTVTAVTRALLFTRLPEEATFTSKIVSSSTATDTVVTDFPSNSFIIFNDDNKTAMEARAKAFTEKYSDFTFVKKQSDYLKSYAECQIYTNETLKTAIIFTYELNPRKLHMLLALFPAYFKAAFFTKNPLTEDEKHLCVTLSGRSARDFELAITEIAKKAGLLDKLMQHMLRTFTQSNMQAIISQAETDRDAAKNELEENVNMYKALLKKYQEKVYYLEGLLSHPQDEDTELVDYFRSHKNLHLADISGSTLKFYITTPLAWFDSDYYAVCASNGSIYNVYHPSTFNNVEDRKLLMDAIFGEDPKFEINMCAYYELSIGRDVRAVSNHDFPAEYKNYIPNPHLQYHACLGDHRIHIREKMNSNDLIGAIEQCIASAGSVNLAETHATFSPFMKDVFAFKGKCLQDANGNLYTATQALKKLKETK